MKKIITLFATLLLSIVTIAQTNSSNYKLVFKMKGHSYTAYLENGRKIDGDYHPFTDERNIIIDFYNNIIEFRHIDSPFKIIRHYKSPQLLNSEIIEVITTFNKPATFQLVLFDDIGIGLLYYRRNSSPGIVFCFHLEYI